MLDCFKIGEFDINFCLRGGGLGAFCLGSMSNPHPSPGPGGWGFKLTGA